MSVYGAGGIVWNERGQITTSFTGTIAGAGGTGSGDILFVSGLTGTALGIFQIINGFGVTLPTSTVANAGTFTGSVANAVSATVSSATYSSAGIGSVTFNMSGAHGLSVGDWFKVTGATPTGYNQTFQAVSGTSGSTLVGSLSTGGTLASLAAYSGGATVASGNVLTATAPTNGVPLNATSGGGIVVTGTGIPATTDIVSQSGGTPFGAGTYVLSKNTAATTSETITATMLNSWVLSNSQSVGPVTMTSQKTWCGAHTLYGDNHDMAGIYPDINMNEYSLTVSGSNCS